jgi:hypothetical protein
VQWAWTDKMAKPMQHEEKVSGTNGARIFRKLFREDRIDKSWPPRDKDW